MPAVVLSASVHDPEDRLGELTERWLPALHEHYARVVTLCSRTTAPAALVRLCRLGAQVYEQPTDIPTGYAGMGAVRREGLRLGWLANAAGLHLCDFDRILHWQMTYPAELAAAVCEISEHAGVVHGRTPRAFLSHPRYQVETEQISNHVFSLVSGHTWDISSGSRGLSRPAAEFLLSASKEAHFGVDAEWPLLLLRRGIDVAYREYEGLEFETPDRFPAEVAAAGGPAHWIAQADRSAPEWTRRLQFAWWTAEAAWRAAGSIGEEGISCPGSDGYCV